MAFLQTYWWFLISVLGALLVFLLFVQGGQSMIFSEHRDYRTLIVNSLGRKWEFTFTTLVVFGGAFFASFPLFYSTSFGGAYWLWMLILVSFVVQAVSYEFRRKQGNLYGTRLYDGLLMFNGFFGCVMLGVAVGMMFFGAEFTVTKGNIAAPGGAAAISQWSSTHGLEAMIVPANIVLGLAVFFLARTLASMYFINNISAGIGFDQQMRVRTLSNGLIFTVLFVAFLVMLLLQPGLRAEGSGFVRVDNIYLHNLLEMWWTIPMLLAGVVMVLYAIGRTAFSSTFRCGIWWGGIGTVLVVLVLFFLAGYNNTAYYPSTLDPASSLTIANSSSSEFTLRVMAWVSLLVPFVLGYIWYVWRKMNSTPLTEEEIDTESYSY